MRVEYISIQWYEDNWKEEEDNWGTVYELLFSKEGLTFREVDGDKKKTFIKWEDLRELSYSPLDD